MQAVPSQQPERGAELWAGFSATGAAVAGSAERSSAGTCASSADRARASLACRHAEDGRCTGHSVSGCGQCRRHRPPQAQQWSHAQPALSRGPQQPALGTGRSALLWLTPNASHTSPACSISSGAGTLTMGLIGNYREHLLLHSSQQCQCCWQCWLARCWPCTAWALADSKPTSFIQRSCLPPAPPPLLPQPGCWVCSWARTTTLWTLCCSRRWVAPPWAGAVAQALPF